MEIVDGGDTVIFQPWTLAWAGELLKTLTWEFGALGNWVVGAALLLAVGALAALARRDRGAMVPAIILAAGPLLAARGFVDGRGDAAQRLREALRADQLIHVAPAVLLALAVALPIVLWRRRA